MCAIEKSLCEIGKSLLRIKNRCMRKKITIQEYPLVFFGAAKPKQSSESILEGLSLVATIAHVCGPVYDVSCLYHVL